MEDTHNPVYEDIPSRYVVDSCFGSGGLGVVYRARDTYLDKIVAIKVLLSNHDSREMAKFQREAKVASSLNHPNLVTVLDFGVTSKNRPYMVMEFVDGKTLEILIKQRERLPLDESLKIFLQICQGLAHVHSRGVLHRDLKPSNIILVGETVGELVKIVDFGLAKATNDSLEQTLTNAGELVGSPFYMSPEQAGREKLDKRSDIYSMGCIMHRVLTGSVPLAGATALETLNLRTNKTPPRLDFSSYSLPGKLTRIVERCLAFEPDARYQTVEELSADLQALAEELATADQASSIFLTPKAVSSNAGLKRRLIIGSAIVLASVVSVAVIIPLMKTEKIGLQVDDWNFASPALDEKEVEADVESSGIREEPINPSQDEAYQRAGIASGDNDVQKIKKLEGWIKQNPRSFSYSVCNELRHLYGPRLPRKSMEYCDLILQNRPVDQYTLNSLSDWRKEDGAILVLQRIRKAYPDFKYLTVACAIRIGDIAVELKRPQQARRFYSDALKNSSKLPSYRTLSENRLKRLSASKSPGHLTESK